MMLTLDKLECSLLYVVCKRYIHAYTVAKVDGAAQLPKGFGAMINQDQWKLRHGSFQGGIMWYIDISWGLLPIKP